MMNYPALARKLKYRAKEHLTGSYPGAVSATVTVQLISSVLSLLIAYVCDRTTLIGLILFYAAQLMIYLLMAFFTSGLSYLYLNVCCGNLAYSSMVFEGGKKQPEKAIQVQLYQMILYFCAMLPGMILTLVAIKSQSSSIMWGSRIVLLFASIIIIYYGLCFSQAFFLLHDFPGESSMNLLVMSNRIMHGHKMELFFILLSFIPMYLIAVLSLGVGFLWVLPYTNATMAEYFLELMNSQNSAQKL